MEHGKAVCTGEGPELEGYLRAASSDANAGEVPVDANDMQQG